MAETRRPDKAARGALAAGVERFDRLARNVKNSQLARTKTGAGPPATEAFERSPEDAWAKKYMTHCIGPICFTVEALAEPPVFAKFTVPPQAPVQSGGYRAAGPQTAQNPPSRGRPAAEPASRGPIGLAIGKPVRRRFWLDRLFGK
jgi:hypothetical protein